MWNKLMHVINGNIFWDNDDIFQVINLFFELLGNHPGVHPVISPIVRLHISVRFSLIYFRNSDNPQLFLSTIYATLAEFVAMTYWNISRSQFNSSIAQAILSTHPHYDDINVPIAVYDDFVDIENSDAFGAIMALQWNALMHTLNGNILTEELVRLFKLVLEDDATYSDILNLVRLNPSDRDFQTYFGNHWKLFSSDIRQISQNIGEVNRRLKSLDSYNKYEPSKARAALKNFTSKMRERTKAGRIKPESKILIPRIEKQLVLEKTCDVYDKLELTGILYDARDVYQYGLSPEDRRLTQKEYKSCIRMLDHMLRFEYSTQKVEAQGIFQYITNDVLKSEKLKNLISNFESTLSNKIDSINCNIKKEIKDIGIDVVDKVGLAKQVINDSRSKILSFDWKVVTCRICDFLGFIIGAYYLSGIPRLTFISSYIVKLGLGLVSNVEDTITKLSQIFNSLFEQYEGSKNVEMTNLSNVRVVQAQNLPRDEFIYTSLLRYASSFVFNIDNAEVTDERARRIQARFGALNSLTGFIKNFKGFVEEMFDLVFYKLTGSYLFDNIPKDLISDIKSSLLLFKDNSRAQSHIFSDDEAEALIRIHDEEVLPLYNRVTDCIKKVESHLLNLWIREYESFKQTIIRVREHKPIESSKKAPIIFWLSSPPGVGKNTFVKHTAAFTSKILTGKSKVLMFTKDNMSEYFEGIQDDHNTIVYDEGYSIDDPQLNSVLSSFLLAAASTNSTPLNMAFGEKGHKFLKARLIYVISNHPEPPADLLKMWFPGALARRLTKIVLKPRNPEQFDFKTGKWLKPLTEDFFFEDFLVDVATYKMDTSVAQIVVDKFVHKNLTTEQFLQYIYNRIQESNREYDMITDSTNKFTDELIAKIIKDSKDQDLVELPKVKQTWAAKGKNKESSKDFLYSNQESLPVPDLTLKTESTKSTVFPDIVSGFEKVQLSHIRALLSRLFPFSKWDIKEFIHPISGIFDSFKLPNYKIDGESIRSKFREYVKLDELEGRVEIYSRSSRKLVETAYGDLIVYLKDVSTLAMVKSNLSNILENFSNFSPYWLVGFGVVAGALSVLALSKLLYDTVKNEEEDCVVTEAQSRYDTANVNFVARRRLKGKKVQAQLGDKQALDESIKMSLNFARLDVRFPYNDGMNISSTFILGVRGTIYVTFRHLIAGLFVDEDFLVPLKDGEVSISYRRGQNKVEIPLSCINMEILEIEDSEQDLVLLDLGKYVAPVPNIIPYFMTQDQIDQRILSNVFRMKPEANVCVIEKVAKGRPHFISPFGSFNEKTAPIESERVGKKFLTCFSIEYDSMGQLGDCGSVYGVDNSKSPQKFFGIHVAGDSGQNKSYCAIITQECLKAGVERLFIGNSLGVMAQGRLYSYHPVIREVAIEPIANWEKFSSDQVVQTSTPIGSIIERSLHNYPPLSDQVLRTKLFPDEVPKKFPPRIKKTLSHDPVGKFMVKVSVENKVYHHPIWNLIHSWYRERALKCAKMSSLPGRISTDDAIGGNIWLHHITAMKANTSPGFGMRDARIRGKGAYFELDERYQASGEYLKIREFIVSKAMNDEIVLMPFQLTMKSNETRLPEKDPRWFYASTLVLSELAREYYGTVCEIILANGDTFLNILGINLNGPRGKQLATKMSGKFAVFEDFKFNDGTTMSPEINKFFDLIDDMAEILDQNESLSSSEIMHRKKMRYVIRTNSAFPTVLIYDKLFQQMFQLPSGVLFTTLINSMQDIIQPMTAILEYYANHSPEVYLKYINDLDLFVDENAVYAFGDDSLFGLIEPVDCLELRKFVKHVFGRDMVPADKDRSMSNAEYIILSRRPLFRSNTWYFVLPEEIIEDIVYWRLKSSIPEKEMCEILCDAALREWALYGLPKFEEYKKKYDKELLRIFGSKTSLTFSKVMQDLRSEYFDITGNVPTLNELDVLSSSEPEC